MPEVEWLDEPDTTERPRRTRPLLLLAASLPWLLVAGLLVLPGRGAPDEEERIDPGEVPTDATVGEATDDVTAGGTTHGAGAPGDGTLGDDGTPEAGTGPDGATTDDGPSARVEPPATGEDATPSTDLGASANAADTEPPDLELGEHRGRWRVAPGIEEAAALGVVVARAWLTGLHPVLPVDGVPPATPDGYAEHLVVEAVEQPGADAAVVTVVGIVLGGDDLEASVRRVAVPLTLQPDGPRVAGLPWELPAPSLDLDEPERRTIDDPDQQLAASEALAAAGLDDHTLLALHDTPSWPVVAEVEVAGRDGTSAVWLRRHLGGFVVSGTALPPAAPGDDEGAGDASTTGDDGVPGDEDRGDGDGRTTRGGVHGDGTNGDGASSDGSDGSDANDDEDDPREETIP